MTLGKTPLSRQIGAALCVLSASWASAQTPAASAPASATAAAPAPASASASAPASAAAPTAPRVYDTLAQIRQTKAITIAHRDSSIPFSYLDADKKPVGYAMDLCLRLVSMLEKELRIPKITVNYLSVSGATRIPAIVEGRAAMECGSTTNNAQRRQQVDYTISHFVSSPRFIVKKSSGASRIEDLRGKTVASTKGTTVVSTIRRVSAERSLNLNIIESADHAEGFGMVGSGKADAFAMDDVLLFGLKANAAKPDDFEVIGRPLGFEAYGIMLPKGDRAFKAVIDAEMRRIILSGEIDAIYSKWFERPIPPKGINLNLAMPYVLRDSFKYPSDKVNDLQ